jgi:hypothetical protein
VTPDVTICIPVYKSEAIVGNAIESVLAQTYERFKLFISVDPSGDRSAEVCRRYASDPRVTVVENQTRLGWVGNVNACLDRVDTPFFAICFHDDALEPIYIERLKPALEAAPNAVAAFGAMQRWGTVERLVQPENVVGAPASRARACLDGCFPAYGLKNLLRSDPVREGLRLPEIGAQGFVADLPFALAFSLAGDFVSVPDVVYRKRHSTDSVTAGWKEFDTAEVTEAQNLLRLHLLRVIQAGGLGLAERQELVGMVLRPRGGDTRTTAEQLYHLADDLDALVPTLLIAELLGNDAVATGRFTDRVGQQAARARSSVRLAKNFLRLGEAHTARFYAEQALRLDSQSVAAHCLLARIFIDAENAATGGTNIEKARAHARKATELDPSNARAKRLLAEAERKPGLMRILRRLAAIAR